MMRIRKNRLSVIGLQTPDFFPCLISEDTSNSFSRLCYSELQLRVSIVPVLRA